MSRHALIVSLLLLALLPACGVDGTEINEIGLVYEGGLIEDKSYHGLLPPGATAKWVGLGSETYRYRTDQRTYLACPEDCDTSPVEVVSRDNVRMSVGYQLYFKLNLEEGVLREFHENLGVKTDAWEEDGWDRMLFEYFKPQVERSMEDAARKHTWRDLRSNEEARVAFRNEVVGNIERYVREVVGGDYFCGPEYDGPGSDCSAFTFSIDTPVPVNPQIVQAVEDEQRAAAATIAQQQENARIRAELEAERELVALYGPQGALTRAAIESGKVQFIVIPEGVPVTVPSGR